MPLGCHYMEYYNHAYAMNQYVASRGHSHRRWLQAYEASARFMDRHLK